MTDNQSVEGGQHPIGVVAERTGLTPDVLRVWERRYGAVKPQRSAGRQRFYSDADIERLRLLRLATLPGRSIGQVVTLSTDALAQMVEEDAEARLRAPAASAAPSTESVGADTVAQALARAAELDSESLDRILRRAAATLGLQDFLESVAAPLLRRVGDEWHAGRLSVAHEHLASSLVNRVTITAMQAMSVEADAPNLVVATLSGERHEAGALFAAAEAMSLGWRVTYLGADLPAADIAAAAASTQARAVAVSVVNPPDARQVLQELRLLRDRLSPDVAVLVGGSGARALSGELSTLGVQFAERLAGALPRRH
jgi:DNA-binding transcriptional MerR regulator/methylmalonyl-CoA mutase cobalamin-binding subunit